MNALKLACLIGTAASLELFNPEAKTGHAPSGQQTLGMGTDDGSAEPEDNDAGPPNPCSHTEPDCGEDPCQEIPHPCDKHTDDDAMIECLNSTDPSEDPWEKCYTTSEAGKAFRTCWNAGMPAMDACWKAHEKEAEKAATE